MTKSINRKGKYNKILTIPKQLCNENFKFIKVQKKSKIPYGTWKRITEHQYKYNDKELLNWLKNGNNYGILCEKGGLNVIDIDVLTDKTKMLCDILDKYNTFKVKTGSGNYHFYFISDFQKTIKLKENKENVGDLKASGQVVGSGSLHPNGNFYETVNDFPILKISKEELELILMAFIEQKKISEPTHNTSSGCVGLLGDQDYTTQKLEIEKAIEVIKKNINIHKKFISTQKPDDRSSVDFLICKYLVENEINTITIIEILKKYTYSKIHERGINYALITIQNARAKENIFQKNYGHRESNDKNNAGIPTAGGGKAMVEFETVGDPYEIDLGYGKFIEISLKRVVGKDNQFLSLSRGMYGIQQDGSVDKKQKKYEKNLSIPISNGTVGKVIDAINNLCN